MSNLFSSLALSGSRSLKGGSNLARAGLAHVSVVSTLSAGAGFHILESFELEGDGYFHHLVFGSNGVVSVDLSIGHADADWTLGGGTLIQIQRG